MKRRLVVLESPYAGDIARNLDYARHCMRDSIMRGEAPLASHLLYAQDGILCDAIEAERFVGMECGFAWLDVAQASVVYTDLGVSRGMQEGIQQALDRGLPVEYRALGTLLDILAQRDKGSVKE